ncbi:MAG: hypothetical protein ACI9W7_001217, partial [Porticoccaceae bacterium]
PAKSDKIAGLSRPRKSALALFDIGCFSVVIQKI